MHNMFSRQKIYQKSESIDSIGFNGGSGWTRTTDLTLIKGNYKLLRTYPINERWNREDMDFRKD